MERLTEFITHPVIMGTAPDPRTSSWWLLGNPIPITLLSTVWLWFVLRGGPAFMRGRKPFDLNRLILVINGFQVLANLYVMTEFLRLGWLTTYKWVCEPCDYSRSSTAMQMAHTCYIYFFLKIIDMIDTIIYVLRRKENQISFLHVYHHLSTLLLAWVVATYAPGGHGTFVQLLNTVVHAVMYTYYFLAALGPEYQKYLWWKKYLTRFQLFQFILQFSHNVIVMNIECDYPPFIVYMFMPIISIMFGLFLNFYVNAYSKGKRDSKSTKHQRLENNNLHHSHKDD